MSEAYGLPLDPDRTVHDLSVGERQRIEIVRCLLQEPKLLIMDEPTSVLTPQEVEKLFATLRRLAGEGCAILYISHKLDEIRALCEKATIMRLGPRGCECDPRQESAKHLAELMIGASLKAPIHDRRLGRMRRVTRLAVRSLSLKSDQQFGTDLKDISFAVRAGEILGIGGIAGNGQNELMAALSGETLSDAGRRPSLAMGRRRQAGAGWAPRSRRLLRAGRAQWPWRGARHDPGGERACFPAIAAAAWCSSASSTDSRIIGFAGEVIRGFDVRTTGPKAEARSLSGGNLQKFIVGREILQEPGVLVVAQPTWGVDAGAAAAIHQALLDLADEGAAIVIISQDLDEIMRDRRPHRRHRRRSSVPGACRWLRRRIEEIGRLMGGVPRPGAEASPCALRSIPRGERSNRGPMPRRSWRSC